MNIPGPLDAKNSLNIAKYLWRVHAQGGCFHWRARDLQDFRNDEDLRRGRSIQIRVIQAGRDQRRGKKVVNLAALRIARARRQRA